MHDVLQWLQVVQIPVLIYLVSIDKRLVRVESRLKFAVLRALHEESED